MERVGTAGRLRMEEKRYGRDVIVVPLMVPDFVIERYLGYARGVMGGNFWIMCTTKEALKEAGTKAMKAINNVYGAVTTFDICSAGSKPETHFPQIDLLQHLYCPLLKLSWAANPKCPKASATSPKSFTTAYPWTQLKKPPKQASKQCSKLKVSCRFPRATTAVN